jgi:hypothetical protein
MGGDRGAANDDSMMAAVSQSGLLADDPWLLGS